MLLGIAYIFCLGQLVGCQKWYSPTPGTSFQIQLSGMLNVSYDAKVYIVDMDETTRGSIEVLQESRRKVMCQFSAGLYEEWRQDSKLFPNSAIGHQHEKWPDCRWLNIRNEALKHVMVDRMNRAVDKGCDGLHLVDVDGYMNFNGFALTYNDQLSYNRWLAAEAHARNLSVGLHNDVEQIPNLVEDFDWTLNDMCGEYSICDALSPFVDAGKAVFGVEMRPSQKPRQFCSFANLRGFSWQKKFPNLNASRIDCMDMETWEDF